MLTPHRLITPTVTFFLGALLLLTAPQAPAAFTPHLNPLLNELTARSLAFSNSPVKLEKRQKQVADQAIRTINRSTNSVRSDITAAGTVARTLVTAFRSDFTNSPPAINSLNLFLFGAFTGLQTDVQGETTELSALIASLPAGTAKTKAQASLSKAQGSLGQIGATTTYPTWSRLLNDALRFALAGQVTAIKAGGTIGGTNPPPAIAAFTANVTNGPAPLLVTFANQSLNATSYAWNFGDGNTSNAQQPSHNYASAGTYTVSLTAIGAGGTNTQTRTGYIGATSGGGSGGTGGSNSVMATIAVNGATHAFVADTITPTWRQSFNRLFFDSSSSTGGDSLSLPAYPFTGNTGAYDLAAAGGYYRNSVDTYFITSGTLNITRFNAASHVVEGSFSFTASNPIRGGNISVNNGTFSVTNLVIIP